MLIGPHRPVEANGRTLVAREAGTGYFALGTTPSHLHSGVIVEVSVIAGTYCVTKDLITRVAVKAVFEVLDELEPAALVAPSADGVPHSADEGDEEGPTSPYEGAQRTRLKLV